MIKIYEEKVFWVLLLLLLCVGLVLCSVQFCQICSERLGNSGNRIVIIDECGDITVVNHCEASTIENQDDLRTIKQSDKNLAPPIYSTLPRNFSPPIYELPPPYPYKIEYI